MPVHRSTEPQPTSKRKPTHIASQQTHLPSLVNSGVSLHLTPKSILYLQRTIGNRAVSQLVMGKKPASSLIQRGVGSSKGKKPEETKKREKKSEPKVIDPSILEEHTNLIGRTPDKGYVVTKKAIGTVEGFTGFNFFTSTGVFLGDVDVIDAAEYPEKDTVQYTFIQNNTNGQVKGAADLVAWYLTTYSTLEYFLVKSVGNEKLALHLQTQLGMSNTTGDDYQGERTAVLALAAQRLKDWELG